MGCRLLIKLLFILFSLTTLLSGCFGATPYQFKGSAVDPPLAIADFELKDTATKPFRLSQMPGQVALIYFGYTSCPDACPLTMYDVKKALSQLPQGRERVKVIFISVDPERDTPELLARYLSTLGPEFMGLSDDMAQVQEVMKLFGAFAEKDTTAQTAAGYLVSHTTRLYLVDPKKQQLLFMYPYGFKVDDLRSDLEYLLAQGPPG
jgi:protein SCO1/2